MQCTGKQYAFVSSCSLHILKSGVLMCKKPINMFHLRRLSRSWSSLYAMHCKAMGICKQPPMAHCLLPLPIARCTFSNPQLRLGCRSRTSPLSVSDAEHFNENQINAFQSDYIWSSNAIGQCNHNSLHWSDNATVAPSYPLISPLSVTVINAEFDAMQYIVVQFQQVCNAIQSNGNATSGQCNATSLQFIRLRLSKHKAMCALGLARCEDWISVGGVGNPRRAMELGGTGKNRQ